jgi:hypothetical protein
VLKDYSRQHFARTHKFLQIKGTVKKGKTYNKDIDIRRMRAHGRLEENDVVDINLLLPCKRVESGERVEAKLLINVLISIAAVD